MNPALRDAAPGQRFSGHKREMTLARGLALSGGAWGEPQWPDRNLHTDLAAANDAGLAAVVVSGTQWEGHLVGLMVELFGIAWFATGELDLRITRSVKIGETVQPHAELTARTPAADGSVRIELKVWCDNQDGAQVLAGTAQCMLPAATTKA